VALGINPEKTIAWIGNFPLVHFFTTKKFGNVAQRYENPQTEQLEEEIRKLTGGVEYSRIHLVPHGKEILFDDVPKRFEYLQQFGQGIIIKRDSNYIHVITLYVGDCYPILITDREYEIIGILHGGYRQLKYKFVEKIIQLICEKTKIEPESLILGIGPGIKRCCYRADLLRMIIAQALRSKVQQQNIFIAGTCTCCTKLEPNEYLFFSHRRSKQQKESEGRFAAVLTSLLKGSG